MLMKFSSKIVNTSSQIKWLASSTNEMWIKQAVDNPIEILLDHAHCERKAAGFAIQLMFRYIAEPGLSEVLSPLAREELGHFERVLKLLKSRGKNLKQLPAPPYASLLSKNIRKDEPWRMLDSFLVAGLIEARSHERMSLLALNSPDEEIRDLYADLLKSEAKHVCIYWTLSKERFSKEIITKRLKELSGLEAAILLELHPQPRMHS